MNVIKEQEKVPAMIQVNGFEDWRQALPNTFNVHEKMVSILGAKTLSLERYLQRTIALNSRHTRERGIVGLLLDKGFEIVELHVTSIANPEWGRMVWLDKHPSYTPENLPKRVLELYKEGHIKIKYWLAVFKTEHAGEQQCCLYSKTVNAAGLCKCFVYHKVVFASPD